MFCYLFFKNRAEVFFSITAFFTSISSLSQNTFVPDDNFEQLLINLGYDSGALDDFVPTANINTVTSLSTINTDISNLQGLEDFSALETLLIDTNELLTTVDLSQNVNLRDLEFIFNQQVTSLNISGNVNLERFILLSPSITSIDLSQNINITDLTIGGTGILFLDLRSLVNLEFINISMGIIETVDLRNGNNTAIQQFDATDQQNLNCIIVDDVAYSDANWVNIDPGTSFTDTPVGCSTPNLTYVPDDNFEQALIDLGYDSGALDDYVFTSNIDFITTLDVHERGIQDLTGIEDFTSLAILFCYLNELTAIDVSNHPNLVTLDCSQNQITTIDVRNNPNLESLDINSNQLTSLDISNNLNLIRLSFVANQISDIDVSIHSDLVSLYCNENLLTSIDVTNNLQLVHLAFSNNDVSELDVTNNVFLEDLFFTSNQISEIDVSQNTRLLRFFCGGNQLSELDVTNNLQLTNLDCGVNFFTELNVTQNTELEVLSCSGNLFTTLDLSRNINLTSLFSIAGNLVSLDLTNNPNMTFLNVRRNDLTFVDVRNGNNTAFTIFSVRENPNLSCVFVDDANYSTNNWFFVDPTTTFYETEAECVGVCSITVDTLDDVTADDSFALPNLTEGQYFTEPNGNGMQLFPGAIINTSQRVYIYNEDANNSSCFAESSFSVTINISVSTSCSIPNFFTPNNDLVNDEWIVDCPDNPVDRVYIFNRFGKLVTQLDNDDFIWNGFVNGRKMISNTYWYLIEHLNGSQTTGHFALLRNN